MSDQANDNNRFMNATNDDGTPISMTDLKAEALVVMFAGSDTTAILMRKILFNVLEDQSVFRKLRYEIDKACDGFGPGIPSYLDLYKLPYLTAIIHESLRLGPSIPNP